MKPLHLEVEGLYSYRDRTSIDFESLSRAGLFGIFGPVGSGKSAILEAITFALYGETARMSRNERSYNMMNLRSDKLFIVFRFQVRGVVYKFTASSTRNAKDFNDIRNLKRGAYRQEGEEWLPLDGGVTENAERIIGLNYMNFRRTIIIPQGKFQEFLQLKQSERTSMLEELFSLEKFNLQQRTSHLNKENQLRISGVEGQLEQMAEVNGERAGELESLLKESKAAGETLREKLKSQELQEQELARQAGLFAELEQLSASLESLREKKAEADRREAEADRLEEIRTHFALPMKRRGEVRRELLLREEALKAAEAEAGELVVRRCGWDEEFKAFSAEFERREDIRTESESLTRLSDYLTKNHELEKALSEKRERENVLQTLKTGRAEEEKRLSERKAEIDIKRKKLPPSAERAALQGWLDDLNRLDNGLRKASGELEVLDGEIRGVLSEAEDLLERAGNLIEFFPAEELKELKSLRNLDSLKAVEEKIRSRRDELRELRRHQMLHERLNGLAADLKPGDPCPLCGSTEHPAVLAGEVRGGGSSGDDPDSLWEEFGRFRAGMERLADRAVSLRRRKEEGDKESAALQRERQGLENGFRWGDFASGRPEEDRLLLEEFHRLETGVLRDEESRAEAEKALAAGGGRMEEAAADAGLAAEKAAALSALAESLKTGIPEKLFTLRREEAPATLMTEAEEMKKRLAGLEEQRLGLESREKELVAREAASAQKLSDGRNRHSETVGEAGAIEEELKSLLRGSGLETLEAVEKDLASKISPKEERQEIRKIREEAAGAEERYAVLKKALSDSEYKSGDHETLKKEIEALRGEQEEIQRRSGELEGALKDLAEKLKEKKSLLSTRKALQVREENLKTLGGLFKARGFVDYVSTLYLRELVAGANSRFESLCSRSMKLELREDNSFAVRDFLNGGKLRSVKTLSGGQTFLASLSLALALADSVNAGNRQTGDEGFFFLDEGFGSLDRDSLRVVMEALWSLGKEKRVVGVISHVEEMKEEIPSFIQITRDEEKGSIISVAV